MGDQGWLRLYFLTGSMDRSLVQPDDDFLVLPDVLDPAVEKQQARRQSCFPSLAETATDSETRATHGRAAGGPAAWDGLQAQQVPFSSVMAPQQCPPTPHTPHVLPSL